MSEEIGREFYSNTKYTRETLPRGRLDLSTKPPLYKSYEKVTRVKLPAPQLDEGPGLWGLLKGRRSVRKFTKKPISAVQLSQLLWATQGITEPFVPAYGGTIGLRTAPSAGGLYPIETYLCVNLITDVDPGIYHYSVADRELELLKPGKLGKKVAEAALGQSMLARGNVVFIWTAIFDRSKWKYKQRAFRYVFLDVGHIAQNLALAAEGLGLGSCQVAAFFDDELNQLLEIDGEAESTLYLSVVGPKK